MFNEEVFRAIDYILALAGLHHIKVIYCLTTYWQNADAIGNVRGPQPPFLYLSHPAS